MTCDCAAGTFVAMTSTTPTDPTKPALVPHATLAPRARSLAARALSVTLLLSLARCGPEMAVDAGGDVVRPVRDNGVAPGEDGEVPFDEAAPDATDPMDARPPTDGPVTPTDSGPSPLTETCPSTFRMCTAAPGATNTALVRVRGTVVSPDRVFCDGEVLFSRETGRIVCVGDDC